MLSIESCRARQSRLLRHLEESRLALAVLGNPKTIYYFSGVLVDPALPHAFAMDESGRSLLVTNRDPAASAAGKVETYTDYSIERVFNRSTMVAEIAASVRAFAGARVAPAALEHDWVLHAIALPFQDAADITPALNEMRRRKDPDEIECMRNTTALAEAGYAALKSCLEPGMTEYQAHTIMYEAMVRKAQTSIDLKGDFAAGVRAINGGGPPTKRTVLPGDLYILDIFPIYHGYMCDLCRTFVAGQPSQLQQEAWAHVNAAHEIIRKRLRPGITGRELYLEIREYLDRFAPAQGSFTHHLGHGLGMDGWEFPWLTPGSNQAVQEGEVIAAEPALYAEALQGGIRLEHNYLVATDGVTTLDSFPMELT
jgi:Xaa-Pro dipeptidase